MESPPDTIDSLVCAYFDGRATPDEVAQLDAALKSDPAARQRYMRLAELHGHLAWDWSVVAGSAAPKAHQPDDASKSGPGSSSRKLARWGYAAMLAIMLAGAAWWGLGRPAAPTEGPKVATLTRAIVCHWSPDSLMPAVGDRLAVGTRLELSEGLVELSFDQGASVVIQGPASFVIDSGSSVSIERGNLTAHVPPQSAQFIASAPNLTVVDDGTEFGLRIGVAGGTELHVFDGKVRATVQFGAAASPTEMQVAAGDGLKADPVSSAATLMPASDEGFVRHIGASRAIVDWKGNYLTVAGAKKSRPYRFDESVEESFNGGPGKASVKRARFREFDAISPAIERVAPSQSGAFSGGFELWQLKPRDLGYDACLADGGDVDFNRLWHANAKELRLYGLWVFPRSSFLDLKSQRVGFGQASALSAQIRTNEGSHFGVRFVIKSGSQYFLSQTASNTAGPLTLTGEALAQEMWARYEPLRDLRAAGPRSGTPNPISNLTSGAGSLVFDTPTSALVDVGAVGLYAESVDSAGWPNRLLEWESFTAFAEPSSSQEQANAR